MLRTPLLFAVLCLAATATAAPPDWDKHPVNEWVKQSPRAGAAAPSFSWEGSGAYDPFHKKWIHHGGHDGIPQGFHTFTLDLATGVWEQKLPGTSPAGVCCVDGANVFDPAARRFVRFPGASLGHGYQWSRGVKLKDSAVWLYDPAANAWTNMRPPPYRRPLNARDWLGSLNATATYDRNHELALSFGGQGNSGGTNNLYAYDACANALYRLDAANAPSPRDGSGLAYDAGNDCLVMFGSQYASDEKTWIYRYGSGKWEGHDIDPHPPGKKLGTYSTIPRLAYDSLNGVCLCVTWDTNTNEHQTWALDVAARQWTKLNPPREPDASMSRSRNLDFDAEHNVFILELSPKEQKGKGSQVWTYRYRKADKRLTPPADVTVVTENAGATVTWSAVPGAKAYRVSRGEGAETWRVQLDRVAEVMEPRFADRDLATGRVYHYVVRTVDAAGVQGPPSFRARTQPRVLLRPVVSVLGKDKVEVAWDAHPASDVVGYNVYRGVATIRTVKKGMPAAWKDNDPEYAEPMPVEVRDIANVRKLNDRPLSATSFADTIDVGSPVPESGDYRFAVYAYLVRAVNRLGTESGPSPYALTIPSAPTGLLNREKSDMAELKWNGSPEKAIAGYHVYKLEGTWNIVRVTERPVKETTFTHRGGKGTTRYWVVAVDALGQEGEPSSPAWHNQSYRGFYKGEWHP